MKGDGDQMVDGPLQTHKLSSYWAKSHIRIWAAPSFQFLRARYVGMDIHARMQAGMCVRVCVCACLRRLRQPAQVRT